MALIYASAVNKRIGNSGLSKYTGNTSHSHGSKTNKKKSSLQHHDLSSEDYDGNKLNFLITSNKKKGSVEEFILVSGEKNKGCVRSISVCREHPLDKNERIRCQKARESVSTSSSSRNCSRDSRDDIRCCRKHSKNRNNKTSTGSSSKKSSYGEQTKTSKNKFNNRKISVPPISSRNYMKEDDTNPFQKKYSLPKNGEKSLNSCKHTTNEYLCQCFDANNVTKSSFNSHGGKILPHIIGLDGRRKSLSYDNIRTFLENNNNGTSDIIEKGEVSTFQKMKNKFKKWKL